MFCEQIKDREREAWQRTLINIDKRTEMCSKAEEQKGIDSSGGIGIGLSLCSPHVVEDFSENPHYEGQ